MGPAKDLTELKLGSVEESLFSLCRYKSDLSFLSFPQICAITVSYAGITVNDNFLQMNIGPSANTQRVKYLE